VPLHDRVLMGPGPSNPYPEVMQALARPVLGHLDPEFLALLDETCDRLRELTTVWLPAGLDDAQTRRRLLGDYGIEVGAGVGPFAGKAWRIGCMGHTARLRNVSLLLRALEEVLAP